jgi:hypothetical protein
MKFSLVALIALVGQTEATQLQQRIVMRQQIDAAIDSYLDAEVDSGAEWGFLKNIVNIDKFFDSGVKA